MNGRHAMVVTGDASEARRLLRETLTGCDRVLVLYDGAVKRELVGAEITEHALIASALNIHDEAAMQQGANA